MGRRGKRRKSEAGGEGFPQAEFTSAEDLKERAPNSGSAGVGSGDGGGTIVATGTPEEVAACPASYTGQYLKKTLE